jgi:ABC-type antimicrobial peptide transport system permease subunit
VTAYSVARRTREIGLRIAVGGSWQRVVAVILRSALVQVGAGIAIGLPAAFIMGRALEARLFGVTPYDPLVISAGLVLLAGSAAIAAILPAGRAARMDPVKALRIG